MSTSEVAFGSAVSVLVDSLHEGAGVPVLKPDEINDILAKSDHKTTEILEARRLARESAKRRREEEEEERAANGGVPPPNLRIDETAQELLKRLVYEDEEPRPATSLEVRTTRAVPTAPLPQQLHGALGLVQPPPCVVGPLTHP